MGCDMFGYVVPLKCELKIKEFDTYKAMYCSLCYELQKRFGYFSKVFLNYDFVFLTMLGISISDKRIEFCSRFCNTNLLKKCRVASDSDIQTLSAAALCVSTYYKLKDDVEDERFLKKMAAAFALPTAKRAYKKASALFPDMAQAVGRYFSQQLAAEKAQDVRIDSAADNTALALAAIFELIAYSDDERRILSRLGYLIGRFVYLADCADDLADDIKKKRFNPLIPRFEIKESSDTEKISDALEYMRGQLLLTIAEIEDCYNLLTPKQFKEILDNTVYLGLRATAVRVSTTKGNKNGKSV